MSVRYYEGFDLCSHRITRNHVYKGENVPLQSVALPILNSLYQVVIWRTGDLSLSYLQTLKQSEAENLNILALFVSCFMSSSPRLCQYLTCFAYLNKKGQHGNVPFLSLISDVNILHSTHTLSSLKYDFLYLKYSSIVLEYESIISRESVRQMSM